MEPFDLDDLTRTSEVSDELHRTEMTMRHRRFASGASQRARRADQVTRKITRVLETGWILLAFSLTICSGLAQNAHSLIFSIVFWVMSLATAALCWFLLYMRDPTRAIRPRVRTYLDRQASQQEGLA